MRPLRFAITLALAGAAAAAEPAPASLPAVARYQAALAAAKAGPRADVEGLYAAAVAAGKELEADLEHADEARAAGRAPAPTSVEGLLVSAEEAIYAEPDPRFFLALADEKGRPVDRAYFERLAATREGAWPVYLEQQTDWTGCVKFDLPELPSLYAGWLEFRRRHPGAYAAGVAAQLEDMERTLSWDCACAARPEVEAGLARLAKALPKTRAGAIARKHLEALRAGKSTMRFECQSG